MADTVKVGSLTALRLRIREDVYTRYQKLKARSVGEEEARNIASAQAATAPGARHPSGVYRRELDALLAPPRERLAHTGRTGYSPKNWRVPE